MPTDIEALSDIIRGSGNIVFFGGAGVSTESGIPDFRSAGGLYSDAQHGETKNNIPRYDAPPEVILSHSYFMNNMEGFFHYYRENMLHLGAMPNKAHMALAEMERAGKLSAVITQNIDGLHQKAGSTNVVELHGSVHRNYCMACGKAHSVQFVVQSAGVPRCACGGAVKPDVVLYGESLNPAGIHAAAGYIGGSDVLIIGGTSLAVYPAAGLIQYYRGKKLIIINKSETGSDRLALLTIRKNIGDTLGAINWWI